MIPFQNKAVVDKVRGSFKSRRLGRWILSALVWMSGVMAVGLISSCDPVEPPDWQPYNRQDLRNHLFAGRPLLLDFTADWCINCKELEKTVYKTRGFASAVKKSGVQLMRVDLSRANAETSALFKTFKGRGVPYVILINVRGKIIWRYTGIFSVHTIQEQFKRLNE